MKKLVAFCFLLFVISVRDAYGQIVINEFSAVTLDDKIELYNNSEQVIVLSGLYLVDKAGNRKDLDGVICPRGFRDISFSRWLDKGGDTIGLYREGTVDPLDNVIYFDQYVPAHLENQSTGRVPDGASTWQIITSPNFENSSCEPSPTETPVPTQTPPPVDTPTPTVTKKPTGTNTPTPTTSSSDYSNIYINEFIPDPESGYEKVEIKNGNSNSVILTNWQIDDIENGGKDPVKFSATIAGSDLYTIDLGTNTMLNNDGDSVRLLNSSGQEKDKRDYSSVTSGKSWSRDGNGNWCLQTPSFGSSNSDCPSSPTNTPTPTKTPTPSPTGKLSPTPSIKGTPTPSVVEPTSVVTGTADVPVEPSLSPTTLGVTDDAMSKNKPPVAAFGIIGGGVVFLGLGAFSYMKGKKS